MTDTPETSDLTVEDILAEAQDAAYHSLLETWQRILQPSGEVRMEPITPQWSLRIINKFPQIGFADMPEFRDAFYDLLEEMYDGLVSEIDSDDECFNVDSPEEDVERNGHHYLNVLFTWQKIILGRELDWNCESATAAIDVAVMSEVHRMFFDGTGITALLDQIGFQFTEDNQQQLTAELQELKNTWVG